MKEMFIDKSRENLKAAEILFDNNLYNSSASRAYYAAFHAAIAAIFNIGKVAKLDHTIVRTIFSDNFFNKRKILPSKYNKYLSELQDLRNIADYRAVVSKKNAKQQLNEAKEFVEIVLGTIK